MNRLNFHVIIKHVFVYSILFLLLTLFSLILPPVCTCSHLFVYSLLFTLVFVCLSRLFLCPYVVLSVHTWFHEPTPVSVYWYSHLFKTSVPVDTLLFSHLLQFGRSTDWVHEEQISGKVFPWPPGITEAFVAFGFISAETCSEDPQIPPAAPGMTPTHLTVQSHLYLNLPFIYFRGMRQRKLNWANLLLDPQVKCVNLVFRIWSFNQTDASIPLCVWLARRFQIPVESHGSPRINHI